MIGRKKRARVVFIDGIPIESATLDAGGSGLKNEDPAVDPAALKELDPRALFDKYDADGSGGIDVDEFNVLLKDLHIVLSEPKALAYFKRCDKMRRGHISFEEFRLALYTCDPKNPNRTTGFAPGQTLSPKDLFEMFDREEQGAIDRATFLEVLEFLGHKLPLDQIEGIFATHEDPETEMMPYYKFKKAWLLLVDVRAELRNRHEKFNRFLPPSVLMKKLEVLINQEEKEEARMLLEAATTLDEEKIAAYRRWLIDEAVTLSKLVLADAMDAAGQVYMFGKGPFGRLDGEPTDPDFVDFMDYEVVRELWTSRVRPNADDMKTLAQVGQSIGDDQEEAAHAGNDTDSDKSGDPESRQQVLEQTPGTGISIPRGLTKAKMTLIAAARAFSGRQISLVPTFLWGKRVRKVSVGAAVAYALTDSGEVYCWGGNKRKWRYFYDTATLDEEVMGSAICVPSRADGLSSMTAPHNGDRLLTTRTEMLKQTTPNQVKQTRDASNQFYIRQKYQKTFVKPVRVLPTDEQKRRKLHVLGQYFDLLPVDSSNVDNSSNAAQVHAAAKHNSKPAKSKKRRDIRTSSGVAPSDGVDGTIPDNPSSQPSAGFPTYQTLLETIEPDLNVDDLVVALELRGVHLAKQTRLDLIDKLGDCLLLELECLGQKFHAHMKEQDKAARRAKHDRQERKLQAILVKTTMLWHELRILQQDIGRIESDAFTSSEREYLDMKTRIAHAKQKIKRQACEGFQLDGSTSNQLYFSGLTSCGAPLRYFDGDLAVLDIAVGSRHALAVHQTGKLFTWGVGSFGRLGGVRHDYGVVATVPQVAQPDTDDVDAWHRDIHSPQRLAELEHLRFRSVCCGFGHSLALTTEGDVYVWGSATHGKLGIGSVPTSAKESFTLIPLQLRVPSRATCRVRKIACGPSHSALITTDGALFVWGSGDGGKLGLGDGRDVGEDCVPRNGGQLGVVETPIHIKALSKENCVDVSCGTAHTVVSTAITENAEDGSLCGGRVFVAGSNHALGKFTPTFSSLYIPRVDDLAAADESHTRSPSPVAISRVSCGNAHTALVSQEGELLTWGNNSGGCTGHPLVQPLIKFPTRVGCMYQCPRNLCLETGVRASQSSQNASCLAEFALQKFGGQTQATNLVFAQTQQEMCPFWQVKLVAMSRIERIVVVLKLPPPSSTATSRTTQRSQGSTTRPMSSSSSSTFRSSRSANGLIVMKYVVLISRSPFDDEERGKYSVSKAKSQSVFSSFTLETEEDAVWKWSVPVDTFGKYVRIQVENAVGMLILASVNVIGTRADEFRGPRVSDVACAEGVTVAICRPLSENETTRELFKRAVRADRNNLWILEQLETYHPFVREEAEAKRLYEGDDSDITRTKCVLCRPKEKCVVCLLDEATFADEIKKEVARKRKEREDKRKEQLERERQRQEEHLRQQKQMMRGSLPTTSRNKSRESERRKSIRDAKARAEVAARAKKGIAPSQVEDGEYEVLRQTLTLEDKCQRLLRTNMRTEEEEEEAEKRLAAELFAIDPVAAAKAQSKPQDNHLHGASNQSGDGSNPTTQLVTTTPATGKSVLRRLVSLFSTKPPSSSAYAKPTEHP